MSKNVGLVFLLVVLVVLLLITFSQNNGSHMDSADNQPAVSSPQVAAPTNAEEASTPSQTEEAAATVEPEPEQPVVQAEDPLSGHKWQIYNGRITFEFKDGECIGHDDSTRTVYEYTYDNGQVTLARAWVSDNSDIAPGVIWSSTDTFQGRLRDNGVLSLEYLVHTKKYIGTAPIRSYWKKYEENKQTLNWDLSQVW